MANINLYNREEIGLLPIYAVSFRYAEIEYFNIFHLEKDSNYRLTPVTIPHYKGGDECLGFTFQATFYVSFNCFYDDYLTRLEDLRKRVTSERNGVWAAKDNERFGIIIILGDGVVPGGQEVQAQKDYHSPINSSQGWEMRIELGKLSTFNYSIESSAFKPRLVINIKGFYREPYSTDPINPTTLMFNN